MPCVRHAWLRLRRVFGVGRRRQLVYICRRGHDTYNEICDQSIRISGAEKVTIENVSVVIYVVVVVPEVEHR